VAIFRNNGELIGGQAVIEGVMMRRQSICSVAVRKPSGQVVVRRDRWRTLTDRFPWLKWPLIRGPVFLVEAVVNGMRALSYSANQALEDEEKDEKGLSTWAMALTMFLAVGLAVGLFIVLPHVLTVILGKVAGHGLSVKSAWFHLVDGVIKVVFFVAYIWIISLMRDIRRVFMYHGAEHKCVHAQEAGQELTVDNIRPFSCLHPRCGTAFILFVLLISLFLFSAVFPLLPKPFANEGVWAHGFYIIIKIILMIPISGLAYELIRLSGKHLDNPLIKAIVYPGLLMQRLTTREPTDEMIEVAVVALQSTLEDDPEPRPV
jgi:uncharacterized protein YqhQ